MAVGEVVTDSRKVNAGDLFVALKGPRVDGPEFIAEVLARGAAAIVGPRFEAGPGPAGP